MTTRLCKCDTFVGPSKPWGRKLGNCRECWLYHSDPEYRDLWGGPPMVAPVSSAQGLCIHRGPEIGREPCPTCMGHVEVKVFACSKHKRCTTGAAMTGAACCKSCPEYEGKTVFSECSQATEQLTIEQMTQLIRVSPPGPWPEGWSAWPNVREAHLRLLEEAATNMCPYPGGFEGQGIVVSVNAKPGYSSGKNLAQGYFPAGWVLVKELRRLGCKLPILFAYLGPLEWDAVLTRLMKPLGVECMDLREIERRDPMRILAGWETKVYAIRHAPYQEVLFLDADNVPVQDPTFLFDTEPYRRHGSIFWPDLPPYDGRKEWLPEAVWKNLGMDYRDEIDFESGQLLIDKERCWRELLVCRHINEHSDYYYKFVFGDKSTFHLAWAKLGSSWAMPSRAAGWDQKTILQYDFDGNLLFQHACQDKPTLDGYAHRGYLQNEDHCDAHLAELRQLWNGKLWSNLQPTPEEERLAARLRGRMCTYRRLGLGERDMRFLEDDVIGRGRDRCEDAWNVFQVDDLSLLAIRDREGQVTALLNLCDDGAWRGQWLEHEKCMVEVVPQS